jgi:hypothetical protein
MALGPGTRSDTTLTATGSDVAPEGPDWGWRVELHVEPGGTLLVRHDNILPDGQEALAIEARYARHRGSGLRFHSRVVCDDRRAHD